jgi:Spy/CpxP family protein refolding chaperone
MDANQGSRKAAFLVLVVFVLGIALGGLGTYAVTMRVMAARPQPMTLTRDPGGVMARFTHALDLTPDQQKQVEVIFNDMRNQYQDLHQRLDPEYEQIRHNGRQRIRQVLTPEQLPKFEALLRQVDEERRERTGGR